MTDEISVAELARRRAAGDDALVLDVREDDELRIVALPFATHVPMGAVPEALDTIPRDRDVIVMCHHGGRSDHVARYLRAHGVRAINLAGGIDAWASEIDESLARY